MAKLPGISISTNPSPLTEENINGATLTLTLTNATYSDPIEASQFTLTTAPAITGLTISGVSRSDDANATVTLAYTGDFDADATLSVTVAASAHTVAEDLTTATVPITANADPIAVGTLDAVTLNANSPAAMVDVAGAFSDPGDTLTYTAVSADINIATVAVSASTVTITGMMTPGDTMITVTATDTTSQTATQTIAVTVVPIANLGAPVASAITEGNTTGTTLTVDLDTPAPSAGLSVLIDITQSDPTATPAGVTYGLDYGVAIDTDSTTTGFSFDSATTPDVLMARRVEVPFTAGDMSRTLTLTAIDDVDGMDETLSIALVTTGITGYIVTGTASNATHTLTLTDNEPVVAINPLGELVGATALVEGTPINTGVELAIGFPAETSPLSSAVTVNLQVSGISAGDVNSLENGAGDALSALTTFPISTGSTTTIGGIIVPGVEQNFAILNDGEEESDETLTVTLLPGDGYRLPAPSATSRSSIIRDSLRASIPDTTARTAPEGGAATSVELRLNRTLQALGEAAGNPVMEEATAMVSITPAPDAADYSVMVGSTTLTRAGNLYSVPITGGDPGSVMLTIVAKEDTDMDSETLTLRLESLAVSAGIIGHSTPTRPAAPPQ